MDETQKPRKLSAEDVAVNNIARAHGIEVTETAAIAALRAAYQGGRNTDSEGFGGVHRRIADVHEFVNDLRLQVGEGATDNTERFDAIERDLAQLRHDVGTLTSLVIEMKSVQAEGFRLVLEDGRRPGSLTVKRNDRPSG